MKRIIIILLLVSNISIGQTLDRLKENFDLEVDYQSKNVLEKYKSFDYDFSNIWSVTENQNVYGIIGDEHQRISIKLISIIRISNGPFLYNVYGKSKVKDNICEFYGNIVIKEIREVKELHFGVDDEYADKGIKNQGILVADYEFYESKEQKHSGIFKGTLYSKWYLNSKNQIVYDDIEFISDGYMNNAFVGVWKSYSTGKEKDCNWADYRVPIANRDFDIGAGEFSVSEKYWNKGWLDIALKNKSPNLAIKQSEKAENQKEWWE
ncbi:MAG: hypothetical protein NXI00_06920 [Cytophagales bacterium]|nr:hypothetical protein [Cytophagales bacterium]